ncbi:uncharacterized protein LOC129610143 [Condylostylus longicornis]|uniref:uncharacterized protein LOC129610143 n=1 Tax=Condylostylus longicornis TaxID=2530218 RepID=UPI00244E1FB9|nr:uncharacterized protein LOC129610143 [Condylostylus longicornis]
MFKFVILSCFIAVAVARPGVLHGAPELRTISVHSEIPVVKTKLIHEPATVEVKEHTIEKIGEHVERLPTGITHHSSTVLHGNANKVTPILAPAIKTRYEPTVRTYEKQFIEKVPVVESYVEPTLVKTVHEPTLIKSYEAPTLLKTETPTFVKSFETPTLLKTLPEAPLLRSYEAPTLLKSFEGSSHLKSFETPTLLRSFEHPTLLKSFEAPTLLKSFEGHGIVEHRDSPFVFHERFEAPKVRSLISHNDAVIVDAPSFPAPCLNCGHAFIEGRSFEHPKIIETSKW